jgi:hypothetical protein
MRAGQEIVRRTRVWLRWLRRSLRALDVDTRRIFTETGLLALRHVMRRSSGLALERDQLEDLFFSLPPELRAMARRRGLDDYLVMDEITGWLVGYADLWEERFGKPAVAERSGGPGLPSLEPEPTSAADTRLSLS